MARPTFKVQDIQQGSGNLSNTHEVKQRNQRVVNYDAEPLKVRIGEREPEIKDAKRRILNRLSIQDARVRRIMRQGIAQARVMYKDMDKSRRRKDGEIRVVEKSRLSKRANKIASDCVLQMRDEVLRNLESSVKTYLISVRRSLTERSNLPMNTINELARRTAIDIYQRPSGSEGKNTAQRLSALGVRIERELIRQSDKNSRDISRLTKSLVDPKNSNSACVSRGFARINRTEQNVAMHQATLEVGKSLGVILYYWRLSAAHKSYNGTEICEVLSVSTGPDVLTVMPTGAGLDLSGLYTEESLPQVPHPNCMCSIEPVLN
jgi:hypothetical protein